MFEREFYDSDLDKIESEKEFLDKTLDELTNDSSIKMITRLLDEEKVIINRHKFSTNLNEKSKLYRQFLEKEKQIYEIYLSNPRIENNDFILNHTHNSVKFDIKQFFKKIKSLDLFVVSSIPLFFGLLFLPYFLPINIFPQISISNVMVGIIAVFIFIFLFIAIMYQNYYTFKVIGNNFTHKFFAIYHIILFVIIVTPFVDKIFINFANYIYEYLNILLSVWLVDIISCGLYHLSDKEKDKTINALLFISTFIVFDFIFIIFVYFRIDNLDFFMTIMFYGLITLLRFIAIIGKKFDYKLQIYFIIFALFITLGFFSGEFVRMARLGNYNDDFIVKTKFVPPHILDANLTSCGTRNATCIEKFDENLTKFTNLKVIVVLDKKYKVAINPKFECEFKDDNKTATCSINDFKSSIDIDRTNLNCESSILHHKCRYKEFTIYKENIAG